MHIKTRGTKIQKDNDSDKWQQLGKLKQ